jgi:hypothetical protein
MVLAFWCMLAPVIGLRRMLLRFWMFRCFSVVVFLYVLWLVCSLVRCCCCGCFCCFKCCSCFWCALVDLRVREIVGRGHGTLLVWFRSASVVHCTSCCVRCVCMVFMCSLFCFGCFCCIVFCSCCPRNLIQQTAAAVAAEWFPADVELDSGHLTQRMVR